MNQLKQQLYELCHNYITARSSELKTTIAEIQEAASNETKSSAGDKYETSREMMQQEMNMKAAQLNELQKLKPVLDRIEPEAKSNIAGPGAVVYTNEGNFYIAVSAGKLLLEGTNYYAISAESPIGRLLAGKMKGERFGFKGKEYVIQDIL